MEIRRLTIADYKEIIHLWSRANLPFKPKGKDGRRAIAAQINANPDFLLGAFEDRHLVGTAMLSSDMQNAG
jgi:hypothetical protein